MIFHYKKLIIIIIVLLQGISLNARWSYNAIPFTLYSKGGCFLGVNDVFSCYDTVSCRTKRVPSCVLTMSVFSDALVINKKK